MLDWNFSLRAAAPYRCHRIRLECKWCCRCTSMIVAFDFSSLFRIDFKVNNRRTHEFRFGSMTIFYFDWSFTIGPFCFLSPIVVRVSCFAIDFPEHLLLSLFRVSRAHSFYITRKTSSPEMKKFFFRFKNFNYILYEALRFILFFASSLIISNGCRSASGVADRNTMQLYLRKKKIHRREARLWCELYGRRKLW